MNHNCPADGCTRQMPRSMLACKTHWYTVSGDTRRRINTAWREYSAGRASFAAYLAARQDAVDEMNAAVTA